MPMYVVSYHDRYGKEIAATMVTEANGPISAICEHKLRMPPCIDRLNMPVSVRVNGLSAGQFVGDPVVMETTDASLPE